MMVPLKKIVCLWLAYLLLMATGLAEPVSAFAGAEPGEPMADQGLMMRRLASPEGVPIEIVYSGRGFALRNNESYVLRLNVESVLPLEFIEVRNLLASNKSLEQIRDEIRARRGEAVYRGGLRLDGAVYPLANIAMSPTSENSTSLTADVGAEPGNETGIQGRITLNISPADDGMVGKGELELGGGPQTGTYSILLDTHPSRHGKGMMGPRR